MSEETKRLPVEFVRSSPPYVPGDIAWFEEERAKKYVRDRFAVPVKLTRDPDGKPVIAPREEARGSRSDKMERGAGV